MQLDSPQTSHRAGWLRFSLRTLLLAALLVSVYCAGRYGAQSRPAGSADVVGDWVAKLPGGALQPVTISHFEDDIFLFSSGANVFNGAYRWKDGELKVDTPSDARMVGLVWRLKDDELTLVQEPKGTPTGSSYLGTHLSRKHAANRATQPSTIR